ncbi:MAG: hypothetical protein LM580_06195, partial [Thermofilum sp.]|nr:hypothetical protein [Thermofilum sp.]
MAEKIPVGQPAPAPAATSLPTVVVGHFDAHGVTAAYLAAKAYGASEVFANYPATSPENVVQTLQNLYAASPSPLRIVLVDIPVDLKNPAAFVRGLEDLALRHEVLYFDHHESSVQFLHLFQRVKAVFLGPSALTLNNYLLSRIPSATDTDRTVALVGAVGDRDPEVVRQGLYSAELQRLADGLDVLVRERDGALRVVRALLQSPEAVLGEARARADQIPAAQYGQRVGPVVVAEGQLPPMWGPKALEKLAFSSAAWYAVGWGVDERTRTPIARAIIRWDIAAKMPYLPLPGNVARQLWPTRNVIGHPAAPSVAATSEQEAREMALQWARALAEQALKSASPQAATFISETKVGEMIAEVLHRLEQLIELQTKMYSEYLDLKRQQVELLRRAGGARAAD